MTLLAVFLPGCHAPRPAVVEIDEGRYAEAFNATRDVLRDAGFPIERVDAARGVLATGVKTTAGFATPWDREQQTIGDEWEDALNEHARAVRVWFVPFDSDGPGPDAPTPDLRAYEGAMRAEIDATILRARYPGWRPETESIRLSSTVTDPKLRERGIEPGDLVPLRTDRAWSGELARRIEKRLSKPSADGQAPAEADQG